MAKARHAIIIIIEAFVKEHRGNYEDYYIGITNSKDTRLGQHRVDQQNDIWMCEEAQTDQEARNIENFFIEKGMDGGPGGGNEDSVFVYVYKKTALTNESITIKGKLISLFSEFEKSQKK